MAALHQSGASPCVSEIIFFPRGHNESGVAHLCGPRPFIGIAQVRALGVGGRFPQSAMALDAHFGGRGFEDKVHLLGRHVCAESLVVHFAASTLVHRGATEFAEGRDSLGLLLLPAERVSTDLQGAIHSLSSKGYLSKRFP